ncbi:hypothetical protein KHA80_10345 [Anaerobacillus sp. HL2]|nr:hypothetical protein KHA80_10345 [Anaerobacillus sp. HL2]
MYGEEGLKAPKKKDLHRLIIPFAVLGVAGFALFIGVKNLVHKRKEPLFEELK